jgi:hypothetical protein
VQGKYQRHVRWIVVIEHEIDLWMDRHEVHSIFPCHHVSISVLGRAAHVMPLGIDARGLFVVCAGSVFDHRPHTAREVLSELAGCG